MNKSEAESFREIYFPSCTLVRIGHNGRFVTLRDPANDFLKIDTHPGGSWLSTEEQLMRASVQFAYPEIDKNEINAVIHLCDIALPNGERTLALQSPDLGTNIQTSFYKGELAIQNIPQITRQVLEAGNSLFQTTGYYNRDLNPSNVIYDHATGRTIIIDWYHHFIKTGSDPLYAKTLAGSLDKFLKPFRSFGLGINMLNGYVSDDILAVLQERYGFT